MEATATNVLEFENVAIYRTSDFMGNVCRIDCKSVKIEPGQKYAQYNDAIKVTYTAKGARKPRYFMLTYRPFLIVMPIANAIDPDAMMVDDPSIAPTSTAVRKSRYSSFDDRWRSDFMAAIAGKNVLYQINTEKP